MTCFPNHFGPLCGALILAGLAVVATMPHAQDSSRLLATSGVTEVEGAGGGGLVPWALITGYGTRDQIGGDVHATGVAL